MTSQSFHLIMLMLIGAMSVVSWHGYRFEPWDRKTALKWNAVAAAWFGYLLWKGVPEIIEPSFIRSGLAVFAFVLALNARRLLLGFELLVIKHWAGPAIFSALRSNEPISADVPIRLGDRSRRPPYSRAAHLHQSAAGGAGPRHTRKGQRGCAAGRGDRAARESARGSRGAEGAPARRARRVAAAPASARPDQRSSAISFHQNQKESAEGRHLGRSPT